MGTKASINITFGLLMLCQVFGQPLIGPTPEVIREIKFLTADATLLRIVRKHDLAKVFDLPNEAAAVARLRGTIDIVEDSEGNALEIVVLSDDPSLAETLTNAVADAGVAHRADFAESKKPLTKEDAAVDLKQQENLLEESRIAMMRIMKEMSIIDMSVLETQVGADALPELPLKYVRAKRAYEQRLAVLNYVRETNRPRIEKPRSPGLAASLAALERSRLPAGKKPLIPLPNPPVISTQPIATLAPESRWTGDFWPVGGIAILILLLILIRQEYVTRRQG